jgi:hypothetical protein
VTGDAALRRRALPTLLFLFKRRKPDGGVEPWRNRRPSGLPVVARPLPPEGFFPFGHGGDELPLPWFFFPMPPTDAHGNREEQARPEAAHFAGGPRPTGEVSVSFL